MILTAVPNPLVAGDSYTIQLTYGDYPVSDGWTLKFYLLGASTLNATATTVNSTYQLTLTPTQTGTLAAGTYTYSVALTRTNEKVTVEGGTLVVSPNIAAQAARISHAEKMIAAIEAVLEGRMTDDVISTTIAGRSLTRIPITELKALRIGYYKELAVLQNNGQQAASFTPVYIQFGRLN